MISAAQATFVRLAAKAVESWTNRNLPACLSLCVNAKDFTCRAVNHSPDQKVNNFPIDSFLHFLSPAVRAAGAQRGSGGRAGGGPRHPPLREDQHRGQLPGRGQVAEGG